MLKENNPMASYLDSMIDLEMSNIHLSVNPKTAKKPKPQLIFSSPKKKLKSPKKKRGGILSKKTKKAATKKQAKASHYLDPYVVVLMSRFILQGNYFRSYLPVSFC